MMPGVGTHWWVELYLLQALGAVGTATWHHQTGEALLTAGFTRSAAVLKRRPAGFRVRTPAQQGLMRVPGPGPQQAHRSCIGSTLPVVSMRGRAAPPSQGSAPLEALGMIAS